MATPEVHQPQVGVFQQPITKLFQEEEGYGNGITGSISGVVVGVQKEGLVVWNQEIYPIFIALRTGIGIDVSRPRFAQRIDSAVNKAWKIASTLD